MAVIGDILVKFVADFAEFAAGMQDGVKKLDEFGKQAQATNDKLTQFANAVKTGIKALGIEELVRRTFEYAESVQKMAADLSTQANELGLSTDALQAYQAAALNSGQKVDAITTAIGKFNVAIGEAAKGGKAQLDVLNQLGVKILDSNGKLRDQEAILREVAQALLKLPEGAQRASAEVTLFGKSGQQLNPVLQDLTKSVGELKDKFGQYIIPPETIKQLDDMQTSAELTTKQIDVLVAELYAPLKQSVLDAILNLLKQIELYAFQAGDALRALGIIDTPRSAAQQLSYVQKELAQVNKEIDYYNAAIGKAADSGVAQSAIRPLDTKVQQLIKQREELNKQLSLAQFEQGPEVNQGTLPAVTVTGSRNPSVAGGGKTDQDNIDAQIRRYKALAEAAADTGRTIDAFHATNIEDFQREVKVQQQVDEIAAKLGARYTEASDASKKALRDQITLYEQEKSANQQRLDAAQRAADIERKYGDGSAQAAKTRHDLDLAEKTNIATKQALTRATKAQQEADEQARLEATRYDDNLDSMVAGFQHAANAYQRANDLYSQGGQAFNALTASMGEGLDVLTGKSNKTFGQIASDFATMLAKMALQAATSQVFKWAFGSGPTGIDKEIADWSSYGSSGGSGLFGFLGSWFGTGRAGGGDVYPGNSYTVGENGPERFVPNVAGTIQPMSASNTGGVTVNLDMRQAQGAADPGAAVEFGRRVKAAVVDVIAQEKRPGGTLYARHNA